MADIPINLIGEILCRCPVKSVIRFKTISPEWSALISTPNFVSKHLRCSRDPILVHICRPQPLTQHLQSTGIRSVDGSKFRSFSWHPGIDTASSHRLDFIGSPNGVVCTVRHHPDDTQDFTLWNPATRSSLPLPYPTLVFDSATHTGTRVGFGFDPVTNDYKIVRLLERKFKLSDEVEVFSLNTGRWSVSTKHVSRMMMTDGACVVADGIPYWIGMKEVPEWEKVFVDWKHTKSRSKERLVLFDVGKERFRTEEFAWEAERGMVSLGVRKVCLCAIVWKEGMRRFDLWVKRREGWVRGYVEVKVPGEGLRYLVCCDRGVVFEKRGEGNDSRLMTVEPRTEDVVEVTGLRNMEANDFVRVVGWADGLTEIPQLGGGNVN